MTTKLRTVRSTKLPDLKVVITPTRANDWDTGSQTVVIDTRNSSVVPHTRCALEKTIEPGTHPAPNEWYADVTIRGSRLRLPVEFSEVSRC
jgi:hypothetical protein